MRIPMNLKTNIKLYKIIKCTYCTSIRRPLILGIETSCDDTGAAIVDANGIIYGESLHSQQSTHLKYGGIIPPKAQQLHRENIQNVVTECFSKAKLTPNDIDAIAVTNRPGLELSLIVGLRYAKHLARHYSKPIIPIHHMEAHALTIRMLDMTNVSFPFLCLLASGGHCILSYVKNVNEFYRLGEAIDGAPGELFDKMSRRLKLRNISEFEWKNGGESMELAASRSTQPINNGIEFPLPMARYRDCQFSFSGLKNSGKRKIYYIEKSLQLQPDDVIPNYEDFCASFLNTVTRHICHRTQRAIEYCENMGYFPDDAKKSLVFSGGVACNNFIFTAITQMARQFGFQTFRPTKKLCTDNGVMIAWNGVEKWIEHNSEPNCNSSVYTIDSIDKIDVFAKCKLGVDVINDVANANLNCKWVRIPILRGDGNL